MSAGLRAIYGMGAQAREQKDVTRLSESYFQFAKQTFLLRVGFRPAMEVFAVGILAGALQWRLSYSAEVDVASYSTVFVLAALSFRPLKNVSGFISQFAELKAVWSRLVDEWNLVHGHVISDDVRREPIALRPGTAISVEKVSYQSWDEQLILKEVSLQIKEGQRAVLLGESGAGKSTLLRLMAGLLPPSRGTLSGVSRTVLATQMPYVFQGTVFENIIYPALALSKSELQHARGRAMDLVLSLMLAHTESGAELFLNKRVGFLGEGLSGGEKARVALARLLYADKGILLLDEPTANLDPASATAFWAAVWRWQQQPGRVRTVIAVTHDLKEVNRFDVAHIFSAGQLVFSGSGDEANRQFQALAEEKNNAFRVESIRS